MRNKMFPVDRIMVLRIEQRDFTFYSVGEFWTWTSYVNGSTVLQTRTGVLASKKIPPGTGWKGGERDCMSYIFSTEIGKYFAFAFFYSANEPSQDRRKAKEGHNRTRGNVQGAMKRKKNSLWVDTRAWLSLLPLSALIPPPSALGFAFS
jgi:hypothetical protein